MAQDDVLNASGKLRRAVYDRLLRDLQLELVKLQEWVHTHGLRVVVVFEGRRSTSSCTPARISSACSWAPAPS